MNKQKRNKKYGKMRTAKKKKGIKARRAKPLIPMRPIDDEELNRKQKIEEGKKKTGKPAPSPATMDHLRPAWIRQWTYSETLLP